MQVEKKVTVTSSSSSKHHGSFTQPNNSHEAQLNPPEPQLLPLPSPYSTSLVASAHDSPSPSPLGGFNRPKLSFQPSTSTTIPLKPSPSPLQRSFQSPTSSPHNPTAPQHSKGHANSVKEQVKLNREAKEAYKLAIIPYLGLRVKKQSAQLNDKAKNTDEVAIISLPRQHSTKQHAQLIDKANKTDDHTFSPSVKLLTSKNNKQTSDKDPTRFQNRKISGDNNRKDNERNIDRLTFFQRLVTRSKIRNINNTAVKFHHNSEVLNHSTVKEKPATTVTTKAEIPGFKERLQKSNCSVFLSSTECYNNTARLNTRYSVRTGHVFNTKTPRRVETNLQMNKSGRYKQNREFGYKTDESLINDDEYLASTHAPVMKVADNDRNKVKSYIPSLSLTPKRVHRRKVMREKDKLSFIRVIPHLSVHEPLHAMHGPPYDHYKTSARLSPGGVFPSPPLVQHFPLPYLHPYEPGLLQKRPQDKRFFPSVERVTPLPPYFSEDILFNSPYSHSSPRPPTLFPKVPEPSPPLRPSFHPPQLNPPTKQYMQPNPQLIFNTHDPKLFHQIYPSVKLEAYDHPRPTAEPLSLKPVRNVKPTLTAKPSSIPTKPSSSSTKPSSSRTKPSSIPTKPSSSRTKPSSSPTKSSSSLTKPNSSTTKHSSSLTKLNSSTTKPSSSLTKPNSSTTKPSSSLTKPNSSTTKHSSSPNRENDIYRPHSDAAYSKSRSVMGGEPWVDFPAYHRVPHTSFSCAHHPQPGIYGDAQAGCQVWHNCEADGRQHSFLCPNGTIFSQHLLTCDWWYNVDCSSTQHTLYQKTHPIQKYKPLYSESPKHTTVLQSSSAGRASHLETSSGRKLKSILHQKQIHFPLQPLTDIKFKSIHHKQQGNGLRPAHRPASQRRVASPVQKPRVPAPTPRPPTKITRPPFPQDFKEFEPYTNNFYPMFQLKTYNLVQNK